MKITIKPLKGESFIVEAEPTADTVEQLRVKIAAANAQFPAEQQKLIHAGRILGTAQKLSEYNLKENEVIVCMLAKAKATPAVAAPAAAAAIATVDRPAAPAAVATAGTDEAEAGPSQPALSPESIQQLVAMGFPEADVSRALRAAHGQTDRAVEYLMSGIPEVQQPTAGGMAPPLGGGAVPFPAMPSGGGAGGMHDDDDDDEGEEDYGALEELRNHPRFRELSRHVAENPQNLAQVLQALEQTNPELVQAIAENQEDFMAMLQEGIDDEDDEGDEDFDPDDPVAVMIAAAYPHDREELHEEDAPAVDVELSDSEREAVKRLCTLGFPEAIAEEAYLVCDKNEDLAASYLFDKADLQD